jgi:hypothetical protein
MKILILTQPLRTNYGGLLQAYALQTVLKTMGHDVVTDKNDYRGVKYKFVVTYIIYRIIRGGILRNKKYLPIIPRLLTKNNYKIISQNTERFISKHIETVDFFKGKNKPSKSDIEKYDLFVVGSDQVWRKEYNQYLDNYFFSFLNGRKDKKTLVYAASFGVDNIDSTKDKLYKKCFNFLINNKAISVREESAVGILKVQANICAIHVLDPTLLLEKEDYLKLIEDDDLEAKDNILMTYILDKSEAKDKIIQDVSKKLNLNSYKLMPELNFTDNSVNIEKLIIPSVSSWISGFKDAKFVVTDSFHGAVFSIIFNKQFIIIGNKKRGLSRFTSLLKIFKLENRMISDIDDIDNILYEEIDFTKINSIKTEWKNKSISFLKTNI